MPDFFASSKNTYFAFIGIILLAVGLRVYQIDAYGIGGDEKYALLVSQFISQEGGGQSDVFRTEGKEHFTNVELHRPKSAYDFQMAIAHRDNGSGATYDLLLNGWTRIFGVSDAAVRSLSLTINILTILLLFLFIRDFTQNRKIALIATFIAAVSPFYIVYSQVARGYALLFFLALLLSYLLLRYLRNYKPKYLIWYSVVALLAMQTHYSVFTLFAIHGLYLLLFHRSFNVLVAYGLTMIFPVAGMLIWLFSMPGGEWALHSIKVSAEVYSQMAVDSPSEWLQLSTFSSVSNQLVKVLTYSVPFLHNLGDQLSGLKNVLLSSTCGLLITVLYINTQFSLIIRSCVGVLLLAAVYFFTSVNEWAFVYYSLMISLVAFAIFKNLRHPNKFVLFCGFAFIVSLVFLGIFAFQDGNTMRIIPRYSGYNYAFACVLTAVGINFLLNQNGMVKTFFGVALLLWAVNYVAIMKEIYRDNPPNYFHHFAEKRVKNPYEVTARKVVEMYAPGDTLIHPSYTPVSHYKGFNTPGFSVQDAQYLNIYLPKKSPVIWQRIDKNEPNKVFLKHKDGSKELLFDFENDKYRY